MPPRQARGQPLHPIYGPGRRQAPTAASTESSTTFRQPREVIRSSSGSQMRVSLSRHSAGIPSWSQASSILRVQGWASPRKAAGLAVGERDDREPGVRSAGRKIVQFAALGGKLLPTSYRSTALGGTGRRRHARRRPRAVDRGTPPRARRQSRGGDHPHAGGHPPGPPRHRIRATGDRRARPGRHRARKATLKGGTWRLRVRATHGKRWLILRQRIRGRAIMTCPSSSESRRERPRGAGPANVVAMSSRVGRLMAMVGLTNWLWIPAIFLGDLAVRRTLAATAPRPCPR